MIIKFFQIKKIEIFSYLCRQLLQVHPCWQLVSCHSHILFRHSRQNLNICHNFWFISYESYYMTHSYDSYVRKVLIIYLQTEREHCSTLNSGSLKLQSVDLYGSVLSQSLLAGTVGLKNIFFQPETVASEIYLSHFSRLIDWWVAVPHVGHAFSVIE